MTGFKNRQLDLLDARIVIFPVARRVGLIRKTVDEMSTFRPDAGDGQLRVFLRVKAALECQLREHLVDERMIRAEIDDFRREVSFALDRRHLARRGEA